ncbi:DUF3558 domain-containing protein [Saccharomonospora xinjiangensis]|uniref:DUF3558 domain-containing protein n=1 Tax=Saccharomonospora xinjiangensis TaxID=75294 RepID=UPI00350EC3DB
MAHRCCVMLPISPIRVFRWLCRRNRLAILTGIDMWSFVHRLAAFVSGILFIGACGTKAETSPDLMQTSASTGRPDQRYAVDSPLDITPFLSRPCDLLSDEVLISVGIPPESGQAKLPDRDAVAEYVGPYCSWPDLDVGLSVGIQSGNTRRNMGGLDGFYSIYEQGRLGFWEDVSVSGYPAAYTALKDRRAEGRCELAVGIATDMSFTSIADVSEDSARACQLAKEMAVDIIHNLKDRQ